MEEEARAAAAPAASAPPLKPAAAVRWSRGTLIQLAALAAAPLAGVCTVCAAATAAELGAVVDGTMWGLVIVNSVSVAVLAALAMRGPSAKETAASFKEHWQADRISVFTVLLSAVCGAFFGVCSVALPLVIGFSPFFVSVAAFEIISSLVLEFTGILWTEKRPLHWLTFLWAGVVLLGTVVFQLDSLMQQGFVASHVGYVLLSAAAGFVLPLQSAFQRRFIRIVKSPFRVMWVSLSASTLFCSCAAAVQRKTPNFSALRLADAPHFLGGLALPVTFFCLIVIPKHIGYPATIGWLIFGQLLLSWIFDLVGAFGRDKVPSTAVKVVGLVVVLVGVALVQMSRTEAFNRAWAGVTGKKQRRVATRDGSSSPAKKSATTTATTPSESPRGELAACDSVLSTAQPPSEAKSPLHTSCEVCSARSLQASCSCRVLAVDNTEEDDDTATRLPGGGSSQTDCAVAVGEDVEQRAHDDRGGTRDEAVAANVGIVNQVYRSRR